MPSQVTKGNLFRALHQSSQIFIIPNPYDQGTARLLEQSGFAALATTSAGYAFSIGQPDLTIDRSAMLKHVAAIVSATNLPVSADLENGFGDNPGTVAETIRLAAETGVVGCSIEDGTKQRDNPLYELELAKERICAAAEAARALPFPFTLTARAENFLVGRPDLKDTITRLQAYQEAGADVLYAPGLTTRDAISAVVSSVDRPVNVIMGIQGVLLTLAELEAMGVRRVSVGSSLSRIAITAFMNAAREMMEKGTFTYANEAVSYRDLNTLFRR